MTGMIVTIAMTETMKTIRMIGTTGKIAIEPAVALILGGMLRCGAAFHYW